MTLTDLALFAGPGCATAAVLILALGLKSRKPKQEPKPRRQEKDFWPNYQPVERKKKE